MVDEETADPLLGRVIDGRFTIQSVLGRGGMGVVYRAHQASLERSVALKLMTGVPPEREAEFQRRFFLEAATAAKLKHPNTITVFDYGSSTVDEERVYFITMELLDGLTLSRVLSQGRALSPLRALNISLQICRSLREAHKAGVVHRDLKPGNVMLVKQDDADDVDADFVKVLDFGLAKTRTQDGARPIEGITKAGTFMGSPRYVAPEQVEGKPVDARADVYSFGCILYRMLAGRVPFDGQQAVEIMLKQIHDPVPPLDVPGLPLSLHKLVKDCLEKRPADRPPSMDAVLHRLKLVRAELGGTGSGIVVMSDEGRTSLPPSPPVVDADELPAPDEPLPATALMRSTRPLPASLTSSPDIQLPRPHTRAVPGERSSPSLSSPPSPAPPARAPTRPTDPGPTESDWRPPSTKTLPPMIGDDSTRPTHAVGQIALLRRPPRRPWGAIAAGIVLGLVLCAGLAAWRLRWIDAWLPSTATTATAPAATTTAPAAPAPVTGPLAQRARVRIKTNPKGADVLEVQNGLPKLLGVTPLTIDWQVTPQPRELTLRKDGFHPSKATLTPPPPGPREPVFLDVEATLRPKLDVE